MEDFVRSLLRVLCPHLKRMAARTANPIDDIVVKIICMIAEQGDEEKEGV